MTKEIKKKQNRDIFDRVVAILEEARSNIVYSVNSNMVVAYWLIGREIVEEVQSGSKRAEYGKQVLETLSANLQKAYGRGFSVPNLQNFRKFYQAFQARLTIQYPPGTEFPVAENSPVADGNIALPSNQYQQGREFAHGFLTNLSWSHYRALMRVKDEQARDFYEREAAECGWSKSQLERQISTSYYERILSNHGKQGLLPAQRECLQGEQIIPVDVLKSPMVLEFLDLPDDPVLHESKLEQAIISNLQSFLLELGKGFSFVSRQKHISVDDDDFFVDLVFYNYHLKCFLLIELKLGKLTHRDVGQMDGYVRLFEDRFKVEGDNPTIGLILCSDKSETVVKYSVLNESRQIFASKYLEFLPTEEELRLEIQKERRLIENNLKELDEK